MPQAAVIAAALTDHSAHPFGLFVGGPDVLPFTTVETIAMTEEGPGGVSSLSFSLDDPAAVVTVQDGTEVSFWNLATDSLLFRGYVSEWSVRPDFGGQGRTINVQCVGVEAWLDWLYIPPLTVLSGTMLSQGIANIVNANAPMLRAPFVAPGSSPYTRDGNFLYPIGSMTHPLLGPPACNGDWVWTGGTLREAISSLAQQSVFLAGGVGPITRYGVPVAVTVDFFMGLRVFLDMLSPDLGSVFPDDYTILTVIDTYASGTVAEDLQFEGEAADRAHAVYVQGGNAAGSGWYSDGSGIISGPRPAIVDATILTEDAARTRAYGFFASQFNLARGRFDLTDFSPVATVHAGTLLNLTDAATGATGIYRIFSIAKAFHGSGRQDWDVAFGAFRPSIARTVLTGQVTR